jgi:tetratricopeptide (TPR) repeat protein
LPVQRNLLEHASLLAGQGELDAAIAMLSEAAQAAPRDLELRKQLAHWLETRGEQTTAKDPRAARADFERALELDPQARNARARLQALPAP